MLQIGSKVHCILYGGRDGIVYNIKGEQHPVSVQSLDRGCVMMGGSAWFNIVFDDGSKSNVPESIVYSVQWRILPGIASAEEIAFALAHAATTEAEKKAKAEEAAKARLETIERIKREHPQLLQGSDLVIAAKNIRTQLKAAFPAVKFSVKTSRYSGGDSINVHWTDGPTSEQVKAITDRYQEGNFNGMEDIYEYNRAPWTDVFGGAKYVFENRHFSSGFVARTIEELAKEYNATPPTVEDYEQGRASNASPIEGGGFGSRSDWQSLITRHCSETSC